MNQVVLEPDVLEARVRLLASTVDDLEGLRARLTSERDLQTTSWGEEVHAARMGEAVVSRLGDMEGGLYLLLEDLNRLVWSLNRSAAEIQGVDDETRELLRVTGERLRGLTMSTIDV